MTSQSMNKTVAHYLDARRIGRYRMEKSIDLDKLKIGVCYYPEHWSSELWTSDLKRMQNAGIEVLRIAEFAWNKFEPKEGCFTFDFFDSFLSVIEKTSLKVIFCTPTATPPAWLTQKYPEVLNCEMDGTLLNHGMRRHCSYNSEVIRKKTQILVTKLAEHYGKHPSIIGWQIDNEMNCGTDEFYAPSDHMAFRLYLKEQYHTLDALNQAWGCVFWNQEYTEWDQVYLPRHTGGKHSSNPHMVLDAKRFFSWSALRYAKLQHDILRISVPRDRFITTNGIFGHIDYDQMTDESIDFITYDSYPTFGYDGVKHEALKDSLLDRKWSFKLAKIRAISPQFGIMEQQTGAGGWVYPQKSPSPKPGQVRLWTFQSIAHGADFISYFRWRTCTFGTEIYWFGILNYDNLDNRRLAEITQTNQDIHKISQISGSRYQADIALLNDYDNEWDGEFDVWHGPLRNASYQNWFAAAQLLHVPFDFVNMSNRVSAEYLSRYKFVVYPHAPIIEEHTSKVLKEYVANGGILLMGARTGYKDKNGKCPMREQPGLLSDLFGVVIHDFNYLPEYEQNKQVRWADEKMDAILFHEILTPNTESCKAEATFDSDYYEGQPALTANSYGKGTAYYFGAAFGVQTAKMFLHKLNFAEPYGCLVALPECCELTVREKDGNRYLFILNYNNEKVEFKLNIPLTNLFNGMIDEGSVELAAYGVAVYQIN